VRAPRAGSLVVAPAKKLDARYARRLARAGKVDARYARRLARAGKVDARYARRLARASKVDARYARRLARASKVDARYARASSPETQASSMSRRSWVGSTGLVKWWSKPAASAWLRSASWPQPVMAISVGA
jgi:hypothetical protein